jgi:hypothetical protein
VNARKTPERLRSRALAGLVIVTIGIVRPSESEHAYMPDSPAEPWPLIRHEPPAARQASNSVFYFVPPGGSRPLG